MISNWSRERGLFGLLAEGNDFPVLRLDGKSEMRRIMEACKVVADQLGVSLKTAADRIVEATAELVEFFNVWQRIERRRRILEWEGVWLWE